MGAFKNNWKTIFASLSINVYIYTYFYLSWINGYYTERPEAVNPGGAQVYHQHLIDFDRILSNIDYDHIIRMRVLIYGNQQIVDYKVLNRRENGLPKICNCDLDDDGCDGNDDENSDDNKTLDGEGATYTHHVPPPRGNIIFDPEHHYKLIPNEQGFIGLALVINMNFENSRKKRTGSEHDVRRLETFLPTIGVGLFRDRVIQDINKQQFAVLAKEFKEALLEGNFSSSFFILMSHGVLYTMQLSDGTPLNVYGDILPLFGESQFREFSDKPKVFIYQSCQNVEVKRKGKDGIDPMDFLLGFFTEPTERIVNALECYACKPGQKAQRNRKEGSYFTQVWTNTTEEFHGTLHIEDIMKKIQAEMCNLHLSVANDPVYKPMMFNKKFDFPAKFAEETKEESRMKREQ